MLKSLALIIILLLQTFYVCIARDNSALFNIGITEGMQSEHVYNLRIDRHGYLWLATPRGVDKYNGYKIIHFGIDDGLVNEDIWDMYEDKKGRMWLLTIAPDIGYIYKDQYKKVYIDPADGHHILSPRNFIVTDDGIAFTSYYKGKHCIFYEHNDTLYREIIKNQDAKFHFLTGNKKLLSYQNNNIYISNNDSLSERVKCRNADIIQSYLAGNYLIPYPYYVGNKTHMPVYNINTCTQKLVTVEQGETIAMAYNYAGKIYITTNRNVYVFNTNMDLESKYSFQDILHHKSRDNSIVTIIQSDFWKTCIATIDSGLYIDYSITPLSKSKNFDLAGYKHIGTNDSTQLWWNDALKKLVALNSEGYPIMARYIPKLSDVRRIISYNAEKQLLVSKSGLSWLFTDGTLQDFDKGFLSDNSAINLTKLSSADAMFASPKDLYFFAYSSSLTHIHFSGDSVHVSTVDGNRLPHLAYSRKKNFLIAYDYQQLLLYNTLSLTKTFVNSNLLETWGIRKIEKICIDTFENIFIKTHDKLFLYNPIKNQYRQLLSNYKLENALLCQSENNLIVAAKAGILTCRILGPCQITSPKLYPNPKYIFYQRVFDVLLNNNNLILNTDKGNYNLSLADAERPAILPGYRFIVNLPDTSFAITSQDTLRLNQNISNIQFDVINPTGTGQPRYSIYQKELSLHWTDLNANELYIQNLIPDHYYTVSIIISDASWKSNPINFVIYRKPFWWQSAAGRKSLWILGILGSLSLLAAIVYVTKKLVSRQHQKKNIELELKNLQLALELKSIYAQINPHFIFNTLTTGLYYIRKKQSDKAYEHISSFSDLLRSYIKASQNKYTTIAEEIKNLKNYLNLQLARFDNKFDYEIIVDENIKPERDKIPSLLLQPLVENAINHGLFHKEGKGRIKIEFRWDDVEKAIICIIDDDGIGREQSRIINQNSSFKAESYGTDLIKNLIDIFNRYEATKISVNYIDKQYPYMGTTVQFTIKHRET